MFAPFLNVLFADAKGDQDGTFPHILNMTGLTDAPQLLIGNGSAINNTGPGNTSNQANQGSGRNNTKIDMADDITVGDILVPLNEIFYITDLVMLSRGFAQHLRDNKLEGTYIMVRGYHEPRYWEYQIELGQPKIIGFLEVDALISLCDRVTE